MIYLATALFSSGERAFGTALTAQIEALGFEVYYPWRDAGDEVLRAACQGDGSSMNAAIVNRNLRAIENSDLMIAVAEGADVDAGVAMELGYAHALGKCLKLLRTDFRSQGLGIGPVNIMLSVPAETLYTSVESLLEDLRANHTGDTGNTVSQFYNMIADEYSNRVCHPTTSLFKRTEENLTGSRLADRCFRTALDIGCGDGNFLYYVQAKNKLGVDCSVEMIRRHHKQLPEGSFLLSDCERPLPLPSTYFDIIHCSFVFDHLSNIGACLEEVRRLLSKDGIFLLALITQEPSTLQGENEDRLKYRVASGRLMSVRRSFSHLADLRIRLTSYFQVEDYRKVQLGSGHLSLEYYVLRPIL